MLLHIRKDGDQLITTEIDPDDERQIEEVQIGDIVAELPDLPAINTPSGFLSTLFIVTDKKRDP